MTAIEEIKAALDEALEWLPVSAIAGQKIEVALSRLAELEKAEPVAELRVDMHGGSYFYWLSDAVFEPETKLYTHPAAAPQVPADAARYRWLREHVHLGEHVGVGVRELVFNATLTTRDDGPGTALALDEAIDAARATAECPTCDGYGRVNDGSGARSPYGPKCPKCGGSGRVPPGVREDGNG